MSTFTLAFPARWRKVYGWRVRLHGLLSFSPATGGSGGLWMLDPADTLKKYTVPAWCGEIVSGFAQTVYEVIHPWHQVGIGLGHLIQMVVYSPYTITVCYSSLQDNQGAPPAVLLVGPCLAPPRLVGVLTPDSSQSGRDRTRSAREPVRFWPMTAMPSRGCCGWDKYL